MVHSLVLDHPFHNGNKRTALVSLLVFLDKNGWVLTANQDDIYAILLKVAAHRLEEPPGFPATTSDHETAAISWWIRRNTRKIRREENVLAFRELRVILEGYDCRLEFAQGKGNRINVMRRGRKFQIAYRNEGTLVQKNTIHDVRRVLQLDEEHGYDSDIFYRREQRVSTFIQKYRKLLDQLSRV